MVEGKQVKAETTTTSCRNVLMELRTTSHKAVSLRLAGNTESRLSQHSPLPKPKNRWWEKANCKSVPVERRDEIFFPKPKYFPSGGKFVAGNTKETLEQAYAEARTYCKSCPVKKDCLESALLEEGPDAEGMRGDKDHTQRRRLYFERKHSLQRRKPRNIPTR